MKNSDGYDVSDLSPEQKKALFKFMTESDRVPPLFPMLRNALEHVLVYEHTACKVAEIEGISESAAAARVSRIARLAILQVLNGEQFAPFVNEIMEVEA